MVHSVTIVIYTKQFDMQLCLTLAQFRKHFTLVRENGT